MEKRTFQTAVCLCSIQGLPKVQEDEINVLLQCLLLALVQN